MSGLGNFAGLFALFDALDDAYSDGLTHITDGETAEGWVISESFDAHGLRWNHLYDSSIPRLDEFRCIFDPVIVSLCLDGKKGLGVLLLAGSSVNLFEEFSEFAGDVGGMAIQDWSVSSTDLTGVVKDNDLSVERVAALGWVVLGVTADIASSDFLDGHVLDVETNIVSRETLS